MRSCSEILTELLRDTWAALPAVLSQDCANETDMEALARLAGQVQTALGVAIPSPPPAAPAERPPLASLPAEPMPGTYWLHPKSDHVYLVEELSYDSETAEPSVRYRSAEGVAFNRPHRMWFETDARTGRPRFVPCPADRMPEPEAAPALSAEFAFKALCVVPAGDPTSVTVNRLIAVGQGVGRTLASALVERQHVMRGDLCIQVHISARPAERPSISILPALPPELRGG